MWVARVSKHLIDGLLHVYFLLTADREVVLEESLRQKLSRQVTCPCFPGHSFSAGHPLVLRQLGEKERVARGPFRVATSTGVPRFDDWKPWPLLSGRCRPAARGSPGNYPFPWTCWVLRKVTADVMSMFHTAMRASRDIVCVLRCRLAAPAQHL